jgi:hypothetical protein
LNILTLWVGRSALLAMALLVPVASLFFYSVSGTGLAQLLSEKELIAAYHSLEQENRQHGSRPLFYLNYLPASAVFYTRGAVSKTDASGPGIAGLEFWLAMHKTDDVLPGWDCTVQYRPGRGVFDLYLCRE